MIIRFGVSNFCSIREYQEVSFVATSLKDENCYFLPVTTGKKGKTLDLLPVIAMYGANASGKTTVLQALSYMAAAVRSSHTSTASSTGTPHSPFLLDKNSSNQCSHFDIDIVIDRKRYHYGFCNNKDIITEEWLYSFDLDSERQVKKNLFERKTFLTDEKKYETAISFGPSLKGENKLISKFVRANSLFLSVAAQNSHEELIKIFNFLDSNFYERIDGNSDSEELIAEQLFTYFGDSSEKLEPTLSFLKAADIGIVGIDFSKTPFSESQKTLFKDLEEIIRKHTKSKDDFELPSEKKIINLIHSGEDGDRYTIRLKSESTGTKAILEILGPLLSCLNNGGLLLIDELNNTLHPMVSRELIKLFLNAETNTGNGQLIFTTHDTNLLFGNLLRRDEIWLTEKNSVGATSIYSLSELKIKSTDNLEKGYLNGRFGAIPFLGWTDKEITNIFKRK